MAVAVVERFEQELRRRRQRERHKTIGLINKTIALHVRFMFLYISLPSSAKQQREMTKAVVERWPLVEVRLYIIHEEECFQCVSCILQTPLNARKPRCSQLF